MAQVDFAILYAYGKAFRLAFANKKITDSLYKTEPAQLRSAINNRIINNTRTEAIKTKNLILARNVADFTRGTWQKDYRRGNLESQNDMLIYYKAVNDTAKYYQEAQNFYDYNYMHVSADSSKKLMQANLENIRKNLSSSNGDKHALDTTKKQRVILRTTVDASAGGADPVLLALNNAAYTFYQLGTHNQGYLLKALLWSKRSLELRPEDYSYLDTYAHLLYRLNLFEDAEVNQAKAVKIAKSKNITATEVDHLQTELAKMKQHKL